MDWEEADLGRRRKGYVRESEDCAAFATGNDGQKTIDCETIVDEVVSNVTFCLKRGRKRLKNVNYPLVACVLA